MFRGEKKKYDLIINISPGSTKSTLCSIMFPAWTWTRMPSTRVIGASYAFQLSMDLSRRGRDVIRSPKYRAAFPEIVLREDQDTKSFFMNTAGGSRYAVGVGGSVTGMHGHFLVVDDPLDPNKAVSEAELKTANRWMSETLPTRKVDQSITPTILIMQRLHQDDPTSVMLEKAETIQKESGKELKVKHICLPAELTDKVKPINLRRFYRDGLMDQYRLPREVLNSNRVVLTEYGFAGQFLQWPIPRGGGMFKTDRIKVVDRAPIKIKQRVRFWDKAGTRGGKGAFTVGLLMSEEREGGFFIEDVVRGRWDSSEREKIIKHTAEVDGRSVVVGLEQEPGSGGKESAESTIRNLAGWKVRAERPTGDKEARADPFSVQVNNGNVSMVRADWNWEYLNELSFFPFSTYKDQVDGSSGAFNMLVRPRPRIGAFLR